MSELFIHEKIRCQVCKRLFVFAENSALSKDEWYQEIIDHVNKHIKITWANVEKEWLKLCQNQEKSVRSAGF